MAEWSQRIFTSVQFQCHCLLNHLKFSSWQLKNGPFYTIFIYFFNFFWQTTKLVCSQLIEENPFLILIYPKGLALFCKFMQTIPSHNGPDILYNNKKHHVLSLVMNRRGGFIPLTSYYVDSICWLLQISVNHRVNGDP